MPQGGRQRSYSQENLAPHAKGVNGEDDQSDGCSLMDMGQGIQKQQALSQFQCGQSNFGDDDDEEFTQHKNDADDKTESEEDSQDLEYCKKEIAQVVESRKFDYSLFKAFMDWTLHHELGEAQEVE